MELHLVRHPPKNGATLGELLLDDVHECSTLERAPGEGKGAIPAGCYQVVINWSPKFGRMMPLLVDVPGFEGVRMHWGNTWHDTEGCILVGQDAGDAFIGHSVAAFTQFFPKLEAACAAGPVFITIEDAADNVT